MNTHVNPPEKPQDALYIPTDISPDDLFEALGRLRKEAEDEIERLIGFLDKTDGYAGSELEEAVDDVACDDNELDADESDDEPSLGFLDPSLHIDRYGETHEVHISLHSIDQTAPQGGTDDREDCEHDGREPDVDDEEDDHPEDGGDNEDSLGWTLNGAHGLSGDREAGGELSVAEVDAARRRKESGQSRIGNIDLDYRSYGPPRIRKSDGKLLRNDPRVLR